MSKTDVGANFHQFNAGKRLRNLYPTEFVIRTMLGTYPELALDKSKYAGSNMLDLGFGDGRNFPLLDDLDMRIHGVEVSQNIIDMAKTRFKDMKLDLKLGSNTEIPFADGYFDYVLACHSCYYVKDGEHFSDNLKEIARVLKPGGTFIFSFPKPDNFILKGAELKEKYHYIVRNDPFNLRNGSMFCAFSNKKEIEENFAPYFTDCRVGSCTDDFYGLYITALIGVATKR